MLLYFPIGVCNKKIVGVFFYLKLLQLEFVVFVFYLTKESKKKKKRKKIHVNTLKSRHTHAHWHKITSACPVITIIFVDFCKATGRGENKEILDI